MVNVWSGGMGKGGSSSIVFELSHGFKMNRSKLRMVSVAPEIPLIVATWSPMALKLVPKACTVNLSASTENVVVVWAKKSLTE